MLGMEALARKAPDVSFIHTSPGPVDSGIARDMPGVVGTLVRLLAKVKPSSLNIPKDESGAYHLFVATSARYAPRDTLGQALNVPVGNEVSLARVTDGQLGSGMYCIDQFGESASPAVEKLLANYNEDGTMNKVWNNLEHEWERITSS